VFIIKFNYINLDNIINMSYILERGLQTTSGHNIYIKSNNVLAKKHFDEPENYADFIINQINNDKIYLDYLKGNNLIILDIGANIGLFSLHCVDCAKKIYSFEPTPKHFELLKEFTNDFNVIIPVNIAISDSDGYIPFYLSDTNTTMNSILNKYEKEITVKGQSIISFLKENNIEKVDFIKCDIEGSEMIALKEECVRPLFDIVDKWFIEVHATSHGNIPQNREVLKQNFENVGYTCQCIGYDSLYVFKT